MLTIRVARSNDASSMIEARREAILAKGLDRYPQSIVDAWVTGGAEERFGRFQQQIADPERIVLVAEADDEVIGYAIAYPTKKELSAIYVKPNTVGRVGHALLSQLEKRAFEITDILNQILQAMSHGVKQTS